MLFLVPNMQNVPSAQYMLQINTRTMLAFNLARAINSVFPCPLFHELKALRAKKQLISCHLTMNPSSVGCPLLNSSLVVSA